jgi:hypothetical protein
MKASRPLWIHHPSSVPLSGTGFENRFKWDQALSRKCRPSVLIKDHNEYRLADLGPVSWPHALSWVSFASVGPIPKQLACTRSGEMVRVMCAHLTRGWMVGYCALGSREPVLVLTTLGVGWHMQVSNATYVVWLEICSWVLIDSNCRYFSDMETRSLPCVVVTNITRSLFKRKLD